MSGGKHHPRATSMKLAYSYLRFSTPEQSKGSSKERQTDSRGAEAWCARHGYTLDTILTFRDEGRSAYHGKHATGRGALARFLGLITSNIIQPGSCLILENLDRFSRQNIDAALDLAKQILNAGVDIVTLLPERHYTKQSLSNIAERLELEFTFHRAHEESRMKSERTKYNWDAKRKLLADKKIVTASRPFWLDIVQGGEVITAGRGKVDLRKPAHFQVNKKAEVVKLCFEMANKGNGAFKISKELLKRGLYFNRAKTVTQATIIRLLTNREVLGEYQAYLGRDAKGNRLPVGEPVEGYFPAIISPDVFAEVQNKIKKRRRGRGCGRSDQYVNLFGGLTYDMRDGAPMYLRPNRGKRFIANWWGIKGKKGSLWINYPLEMFETAMLQACRELDPSLLLPVTPLEEELSRLEAEYNDLLMRIERAQERADNATDEAEEEVAVGSLTRLVRKRKELEKALDEVRSKASQQPAEQMKRLKGLIEVINTAEDKDNARQLVKGLIASLVTRIDIHIQRQGKFRKRAWCEVHFINQVTRFIYIDPDGIVVTIAHEKGTKINIPTGDGWE